MPKLTNKIIKKLSIEKWEWLYEHPEKRFYEELDPKIIQKIEKYYDGDSDCLLCVKFMKIDFCPGCPIYENDEYCLWDDSYYSKWYYTGSIKERKEYAKKILNIIKEWEI